MQRSKPALVFVVLTLAFAFHFARAQSPTSVTVQAASPPSVTSTIAASPVQGPDSVQSAIKLLQQIKATNDETLKKQQETLIRIDELQKAAEQIKIFSSRD
jgi:cell shape-determining protein MreC